MEVQLAVTDEGGDTLSTDRATLWLDDRAEEGWDGYDATDFPPPAIESYATATFPVDRDGNTAQRMLASEPYPAGGETEVSVPLSVAAVDVSGTATLAWPEEEREDVPEGWTIRLTDTKTGESTNLRSEMHTFSLSKKASAAKASEARLRLELVSSPLPVELVQFEGTTSEDGVALRWQTASETGNAGFEVQRRVSEEGWEQIAFVEGSGTTAEAKTYRHKDIGIPYATDTLRYRLRQVDTDGSSALSDPVVVDRGAPGELELLGTFPNPAQSQVTVRYAVPESQSGATLRLYDILGRQVRSKEVGTGRHEQHLDISGLGSGVYFLRLRAGGETKTQKLTVVQ